MFSLHIPMPRSVHFVGLAAGLLLTISELLAMSGGIEALQETTTPAAAASVQVSDNITANDVTSREIGQRSEPIKENALADARLSLAGNY